jgi:Fe-S-cluster-containing dehydrogenase component
MKEGRRTFLKVAGLTALGAAGGSLFGQHAKGAVEEGARSGGGRRWAMVIDPRRCLRKDGCTACMDVCDKVHNVPHIPNPKHEVKWIWRQEWEEAFPEQEAQYIDPALTSSNVVVFCNHCDNPPCVRVCPTGATFRRDDGIVMMDWHRCIGCRYCMAGCPYGSRSFNWEDPRLYLKEENPDFPTRTKGVVEKCTLCEERLDKGQPPACVEACPEKAMVFGDLDDPDSEVRELLRSRFAVRRKASLGTHPEIYYLV